MKSHIRFTGSSSDVHTESRIDRVFCEVFEQMQSFITPVFSSRSEDWIQKHVLRICRQIVKKHRKFHYDKQISGINQSASCLNAPKTNFLSQKFRIFFDVFPILQCR